MVNVEVINEHIQTTAVGLSSETTNGALMTAQATVDGRPVQLMLDSGSQRNWIATELAEQLQSPIDKTELLTVTTINDQKQQLPSNRVQLTVGTTSPHSDWHVHTAANTINHLMDVQDQEYLYLRDPDYESLLADDYTNPTFTYDPQIIVGIDTFWTIILSDRHLVLPSGRRLIPTQLGFVLSGASTPVDVTDMFHTGVPVEAPSTVAEHTQLSQLTPMTHTTESTAPVQFQQTPTTTHGWPRLFAWLTNKKHQVIETASLC